MKNLKSNTQIKGFLKGIFLISTLFLFGILFFSFVLLATPNPIHGEGFEHKDFPRTLRTAWQSTVQIRVTWEDLPMGKRKKPMIGSGIILDYEPMNRTALVVTSNHCINLRTKRPFRFIVRIPGISKYYNAKKAVILMSHPEKDLVYLKVTYPASVSPTAAVLKYTDSKTDLSGDVFSIGFPILRLRAKKSWKTAIPKNYLKTLKRFSKGDLLAKGLSRDKVTILAHNSDILAGNSGGPLVDENGKIIGINAGLFDDDGKTGKNSGRYDYSPGTAKRFYYAISTSEVLKDYEYIQNRNLWRGSREWFVKFAGLINKNKKPLK